MADSHPQGTNNKSSAVSLDDLLNKEQQLLQRGDSYKSTGRRTELATSYTVSSNNTFTTSNTSLSISDRAGARRLIARQKEAHHSLISIIILLV